MTDPAPRFQSLSTPLVADACLRLKIPIRPAPPGLRAAVPGRAAGRVLPARHAGSVDVFFEAFERARPGDVLVIDNGGRLDEACIGDLTALEARAAGVAAILVWGLHRDTAELRAIGLPIYSLGACPAGPQRLDPPQAEALLSARFGDIVATAEDAVFADDDGAVFVPMARVDEVLARASEIGAIERRQAEACRAGTTLRQQLQFADYLRRRAATPGLTFRQHLRRIQGAIEE
jgi:regulator of RNase E activity RraA